MGSSLTGSIAATASGGVGELTKDGVDELFDDRLVDGERPL